jgi:hypothetical protein
MAPQLTHPSGRWIAALAIGFGAVILAYFYALDRALISSASFTPMFRLLLMSYDARTAWLAAAACLLAAVWNRPGPVLGLVDWLASHRSWVVLATVLLAELGSLSIYRSDALSMDEYAALFQAKVFASAAVHAQVPPPLLDWLVVRGFNGSFLFASHETGNIVEGYWPGFALLLAPFEWAAVPGLCNALLAGLAAYLVHRITLEITDSMRAAGWAVLFLLACGAFWANAIALYSMQAHLTANLLFAWLLLRPTPLRAAAAGVVGSIALVLHNPFPHLLFAVPWLFALALDKAQRRYLVPLALGYLPLGLVLGVGWLEIRAAIAPTGGGSLAQFRSYSWVFALPDASLLAVRVASAVKMWLWAAPGLYPLAVLGWLRCRGEGRMRTLAQSALLTFAGYCFVKLDQGHGWGYRYFHSALGVIPILAAGAFVDRGAESAPQGANPRLACFAGAAAVLGLLAVVPFQLMQVDEVIARQWTQIPPPQRPGNNVYFIHPGRGFFVADMVQFDPLLRNQDLMLVSRGAQLDQELIRQNWPDAVEAGGSAAADHWYLGPRDQRQSTPGTRDQPHFIFNFDAANRPR